MAGTAALLPARYADLERFCAAWALETSRERHLRRVSSTMEELRDFYGAMQPRVEEILAYLDGQAAAPLPPADQRLLLLCLALADVALAIEKYRSPTLPDAPFSTKFDTDTTALDQDRWTVAPK